MRICTLFPLIFFVTDLFSVGSRLLYHRKSENSPEIYVYIIIAAHVQDGTAHWQRTDRKDFSGQIHHPLRRQGILYEKILRVAPWRTLRRCRQENTFSEIGGFLHANLSLHVEANERLTFYFYIHLQFHSLEKNAWHRFPLKKTYNFFDGIEIF